MDLPFTVEQFIEVFRKYNTAVFPMQVIFYLLAIVVIYFSLRKTVGSAKVNFIILSFFWIWMAIAYHFLFFSPINKAAYVFGGVFILEAFLLLFHAIKSKTLAFQFRFNTYGITGAIMILFALVIYPVISAYAGHVYPASPTFGLPCPTTIFTFGILLWVNNKVPLTIIAIPFLWSLVGFSAAIVLGMYEDVGLLVAGLITTTMIAIRNRRLKAPGVIYN